MDIYKLKCFGTTASSGSEAVIIENDGFTIDERLAFTQKQNKSACIFIQKRLYFRDTIQFGLNLIQIIFICDNFYA